jgi:hypothetical protein
MIAAIHPRLPGSPKARSCPTARPPRDVTVLLMSNKPFSIQYVE